MSEQLIMQRYNHLMNEIESVYHNIALKLDMSDSAMLILYTVCSKGEKCLLNDITHSSGISKQTVNSALRKLEAEKIVYLESTGGRKKIVCLTDKGKTYAENTVMKVLKMENDIFDSWTEKERAAYIELTQKYLKSLRLKVQELR